MPELPEVQTVVNDLNKRIGNHKIFDFYSFWKKNVCKGNFAKFRKEIVGKTIKKVFRKGKYILIELDSKKIIVVHLRMTGVMIVEKKLKNKSESEESHVRHFWLLKKQKSEVSLLFCDVRKFGTVELVEKERIFEHQGLGKLGIEPLNGALDGGMLKTAFKNSAKKTTRQALLDQNKITGIGNIYVSEILFDAKIKPQRKCGSLRKREWEILAKSIVRILQKAIKNRGTTFSDYRDSSGKKGGFQNLLNVYNREGSSCRRKNCLGGIKKEKLQGRSAFWCSKCQK